MKCDYVKSVEHVNLIGVRSAPRGIFEPKRSESKRLLKSMVDGGAILGIFKISCSHICHQSAGQRKFLKYAF